MQMWANRNCTIAFHFSFLSHCLSFCVLSKVKVNTNAIYDMFKCFMSAQREINLHSNMESGLKYHHAAVIADGAIYIQ